MEKAERLISSSNKEQGRIFALVYKTSIYIFVAQKNTFIALHAKDIVCNSLQRGVN